MKNSNPWARSALFCLSVFCSLVFWSCQKDQELEQTVRAASEVQQNQALLRPGTLQLGAQKQNPYSLPNMRTALANIQDAYSKDAAQLSIRATHLYIKVPVADSVELTTLEEYEWDNDLDFFAHPLDYEILSYADGTSSRSEDIYIPRYTSLPVGAPALSKLPLAYEVLAELYLPDTDRGQGGTGSLDALLDALEEEALKITGNEEEESGERSGSFYPKGHIKFKNTHSGAFEGVPDVKVRARRWFTWKHDYTNNAGYYFISHSFKKKVNYSVKYKNNYAKINASGFGTWTAVLNGPKKKGDWNHNANQNTKPYLWGAIMRGVYDYHKVLVPTYGIGAPPNNLKIRACPNNDCGVTTMLHANLEGVGMLFGSWLTNDIKIGKMSDIFQRIYKTTIHELGHAAHWNLVGDFFISSDWTIIWSHKLVREGWATGVTNVGYELKFGTPYYGDCNPGGIEDMIDDGYPRILVRDLMDRINEFRMSPGPGDNYTVDDCDVIDNVDGFTLSEVFNALQGVGAISTNNAMGKWKDNLEDVIPAEAADLEEYFDQWEL